jgi:hypothetical protein
LWIDPRRNLVRQTLAVWNFHRRRIERQFTARKRFSGAVNRPS